MEIPGIQTSIKCFENNQQSFIFHKSDKNGNPLFPQFTYHCITPNALAKFKYSSICYCSRTYTMEMYISFVIYFSLLKWHALQFHSELLRGIRLFLIFNCLRNSISCICFIPHFRLRLAYIYNLFSFRIGRCINEIFNRMLLLKIEYFPSFIE